MNPDSVLGGDGASVSDRPTVKYVGRRASSGALVLRIDDRGDSHPLPQRLDLRSHSPTGFEWGYGGSGPAQLALAILADAIGAKKAQDGGCYQRFKFDVIAALQAESWELTREDVLLWYQRHQSTTGSE